MNITLMPPLLARDDQPIYDALVAECGYDPLASRDYWIETARFLHARQALAVIEEFAARFHDPRQLALTASTGI